ncbi:MAG: hypothetical protein Kow0031_07430 [Anaerolineae bacterium]
MDHRRIKSVLFSNPYTGSEASVQAVLSYAGGAQRTEDWIGLHTIAMCRDFAAENITQVELTIIPATPDGSLPAYRPEVFATNIGCWRWEGSATVTTRENIVDNVTDTVEAKNLVYENARKPGQFGNTYEDYFPLKSGSVTWRRQGVLSECVIDGGPKTVAAQPGDGDLDINTFITSGPFRRVIAGTGSTDINTNYTITCPDSSSFDVPWPTAGWFAVTAGQGFTVSPDGITISGVYTDTTYSGTITYEWNFRSVSQTN